MLPRINQSIGHIKLSELRASHLNEFYVKLQEEGKERKFKCKSSANLIFVLKEKGITRSKLIKLTGLSPRTIYTALAGNTIQADSASKISKALECPLNELFGESTPCILSTNTIRGYHRLISSILTKAVKWGFIPLNPAANAEPPKQEVKEAISMDEQEARRLLELLQKEPIPYRTAITLDLLSGLRRGELLGLRWKDVDFENETVTIIQTSNYVSGYGIYVDSPKNRTSSRPLKLSRSVFAVLREYQEWQKKQRERCGGKWKDEDGRVFTSNSGAPIHPDTLSRWFREFAKKNGFPGVHIHTLRHTYASLMIADGVPLVVISKRLGHAQVSTTSNIYSHVIASADEKAAQVSERFADVIATEKEE